MSRVGTVVVVSAHEHSGHGTMKLFQGHTNNAELKLLLRTHGLALLKASLTAHGSRLVSHHFDPTLPYPPTHDSAMSNMSLTTRANACSKFNERPQDK